MPAELTGALVIQEPVGLLGFAELASPTASTRCSHIDDHRLTA
jgi:hypothetical protein